MTAQGTNSDKKFSRYQVLVIILLVLTQFTVVLDFMVMCRVSNLIKEKKHIDKK